MIPHLIQDPKESSQVDSRSEREEILRDYQIASQSRQASLLGRREVLTGKAKFGIFGDGKEVAQLAMARAFRPGDFRSGYYRDQTFMLATGMTTLVEGFAQLYATPDSTLEPASSGRQMNAHFATRTIDSDGSFRPLRDLHNSSADCSPTASQMPRLVGLGYASSLFRQIEGLADLPHLAKLSENGNEVAFGTIGNASCAEGMFWESVNAIGVLGAPVVLSIWDDEYGISVPNEHQVTKADLSALLAGFRREPGKDGGFHLYTVKGWDYPALCQAYERAAEDARTKHIPAIVHVVELTQPQGHSTSGSHERYKSPERLEWERQHDCLPKMRQWIIEQELASEADLDAIDTQAISVAKAAKEKAWNDFSGPVEQDRRELVELLENWQKSSNNQALEKIKSRVLAHKSPMRRHLMSASQDALRVALSEPPSEPRDRLLEWRDELDRVNRQRYSTHLHSESSSALEVGAIEATFAADAPLVNGFEVLNKCFEEALGRIPELVAFGEDLGKLGDVNQGFSGLQEKFGPLRVADVGIRECTILGQAIGLALRGFRPLAEIQYLDYILYALQIISDDLATLSYRTAGAQKAPVIVRTRGHRLEGIWHSGSPIGGLLGLVRGVHLCVPRDMVRAAGFYNTLWAADDSAIVIEVLNGYRSKERLPSNIGQLRIPLGIPEVLRAGVDLTIVTYGACCRLALTAAEQLSELGIEVEVIDVQTLLPFDREARIRASLQKTNRIVFLDEDVPGGATAYMLQQVIEHQGGYHWLDAPPRTLTAQAHRPAYGSDGDYWSKPNVEEIFAVAYDLVREAEPRRFPNLSRRTHDDRDPR